VQPSNDCATNDIVRLSKVLDSAGASDSVIDSIFDIATDIIGSLPSETRLSNEDKLRLYGLYKQSKNGDVNIDAPSQVHFAEYAKFEAWQKCVGLSSAEAKKLYFAETVRIVEAAKLSVRIFDDDESVPAHLKEFVAKSKTAPSNALRPCTSKMDSETFDAEVHGDADELFNRFDLSTREDDGGPTTEAVRTFLRAHLKAQRIDINKQSKDTGTTFLCFAVDNGRLELAQLLIEEFGAAVNVADDMGYTPLHCAAMNEDTEMIELLKECGADLSAKSEDEETPRDMTESAAIKQLLTQP